MHRTLAPLPRRLQPSLRNCLSPLLVGLAVVSMLPGCSAPIRLYPDPTASDRPASSRAQFPTVSPARDMAPAPPPLPPPSTAAVPAAMPESVMPPQTTTLSPQSSPSIIAPPNALPQAAAADDRATRLRDWIEQQRRLYRVAAPLLMNNMQLCPQFSRRILGFTAKNQYSYSSEFALVARDALGLDDALQIANVLPYSGAEVAGLQRGDILVSSAGQMLAKGPDAERAAASQLADATEGNSAVELTVQRSDERISTNVRLTPACAMVIDLGNSDVPASFADGRRVLVTRGMLGFAQSDAELAYVLAREMAANIAAPGPKPEIASLIDRLHTLNAQAASAIELPAGNLPPTSSETEAAADRLALYLLARAGVPIAGVHDFWARLAETTQSEPPGSLGAQRSPMTRRLAVIDRESSVIEMKRKKGAALLP